MQTGEALLPRGPGRELGPSPEGLRAHRARAGATPAPLSCWRCGRPFASRQHLEQHACPAVTYICTCGQAFLRYGAMQEHARGHDDVLVLDYSGARLARERGGPADPADLRLLIHGAAVSLQRRFLPVVRLETRRRFPGAGRHRCGRCQRAFRSLDQLADHHAGHRPERVSGCRRCGRLLVSPEPLVRHACPPGPPLRRPLRFRCGTVLRAARPWGLGRHRCAEEEEPRGGASPGRGRGANGVQAGPGEKAAPPQVPEEITFSFRPTRGIKTYERGCVTRLRPAGGEGEPGAEREEEDEEEEEEEEEDCYVVESAPSRGQQKHWPQLAARLLACAHCGQTFPCKASLQKHEERFQRTCGLAKARGIDLPRGVLQGAPLARN
ncbi:zinc finger protein 771-like [Lepisosteus oculatus]|uniref:zinc finger protein 771-like n=1 Tax=Lepisosteus oculatus TaxID=7918 RepID=UPI003721E759